MVFNRYERGRKRYTKYIGHEKRGVGIDALKVRIIEFSSDRMRLEKGGITLFRTYNENLLRSVGLDDTYLPREIFCRRIMELDVRIH